MKNLPLEAENIKHVGYFPHGLSRFISHQNFAAHMRKRLSKLSYQAFPSAPSSRVRQALEPKVAENSDNMRLQCYVLKQKLDIHCTFEFAANNKKILTSREMSLTLMLHAASFLVISDTAALSTLLLLFPTKTKHYSTGKLKMITWFLTLTMF